MQEEAAEKGGTVYVSVPECGIDGDAEVLAINACPPIQDCPPGYRTVTGTFHHQNAKVIDLYIEGLAEPIGTTPNHPFWSVNQRKFIRADELSRGELLLGIDDSITPVASLQFRSGTYPVFNLEVLAAHAYHVSCKGILVHNGCSVWNPKAQRWQDSKTGKFTKPPDAYKIAEEGGRHAGYLRNVKKQQRNPEELRKDAAKLRKRAQEHETAIANRQGITKISDDAEIQARSEAGRLNHLADEQDNFERQSEIAEELARRLEGGTP